MPFLVRLTPGGATVAVDVINLTLFKFFPDKIIILKHYQRINVNNPHNINYKEDKNEREICSTHFKKQT